MGTKKEHERGDTRPGPARCAAGRARRRMERLAADLDRGGGGGRADLPPLPAMARSDPRRGGGGAVQGRADAGGRAAGRPGGPGRAAIRRAGRARARRGAGAGRRDAGRGLRHQRSQALQVRAGLGQAAAAQDAGRRRGRRVPLVARRRAAPGAAEGGRGAGRDGGAGGVRPRHARGAQPQPRLRPRRSRQGRRHLPPVLPAAPGGRGGQERAFAEFVADLAFARGLAA